MTPLFFYWGVRFEIWADGLVLFHPNGERFQDPETLFEERDLAQRERDLAQEERDRAFAKLRELGIDPSSF